MLLPGNFLSLRPLRQRGKFFERIFRAEQAVLKILFSKLIAVREELLHLHPRTKNGKFFKRFLGWFYGQKILRKKDLVRNGERGVHLRPRNEEREALYHGF